MINDHRNNGRFNLYLLEEGEVYIKEYLVELKENDGFRKTGVLYFNSRSIVFDPSDIEYPVEKYLFRNIINYLVKDQNNKILLKGNMNSIIEEENLIHNSHNSLGNNNSNNYVFIANFTKKVVISSQNQPFKFINDNLSIELSLIYEQNKLAYELIMKVIQIFNSKVGFDPDSLSILDMFYKHQFDLTKIKQISEICLLKKELKVIRILPLIEVPGVLMLTDIRIYYQQLYILNSTQTFSIEYSGITNMFRRHLKLKDLGLEILYIEKDIRQSLLIEFDSTKNRDMIFDLIVKHIGDERINSVVENNNLSEMTKKWVAGELSNYDYLCYLNSAANRTRNHLSQYPIFPWVLSNYNTLDLDLNCPSNYRDLSRPIGKLNEKRFKSLKDRYENMGEPRYLYGTHYSTPAYVIGYLFRSYPQYMIKLQSGKYDHPDRLFSSIEIDWDICLTNQGCLKELIPEFYEEDENFLINHLNLPLGLKELNGDAKLPLWARNPKHFLKTMREALESEIVSKQLNEWIDLIFGYKQRGENAIKFDNSKF